MQTTIVTGFSKNGYEEYGERFLDTFNIFNASEMPLHIYTSGMPLTFSCSLCEQFEQSDIGGLDEFISDWSSDPRFSGKSPTDGWNGKERVNGYSYRFDAIKFCKMVFTMWWAAHTIADDSIFVSEYMIWLDGDTVVRKIIIPNIASQALPDGYDFAYLGREPKHTETGFLVFRLPEALPILDSWVKFYMSGEFTHQKEWHSAFLFDRAREKHPEIKGYNLTPGGRGHVIHQCWVGSIFDHCKGNRKIRGRSPEAK